MHAFEKLIQFLQSEEIPKELEEASKGFLYSYAQSIKGTDVDFKLLTPLLKKYLDFVLEQRQNPFPFEPFHRRILKPFNYYRFGLDLFQPLIVMEKSKVLGLEHIEQMISQMEKGENVILLANHQTEPDPQIISILLEKTHPHFAEEMIFIAGHRVITDPLAVPFSKGCNLLCIYSKKYIEHPPEQRTEKLIHNQRTMKKMAQLLDEGGKCIYVAPSGGRDRLSETGKPEVAPFDPQSIELFWLMGQQAASLTHFYPLSLSTYSLLPPPSHVKKELGEERNPQRTPVHLSFGDEIDMENFPGSEGELDRWKKRQLRAEFIYNLVKSGYEELSKLNCTRR